MTPQKQGGLTFRAEPALFPLSPRPAMFPSPPRPPHGCWLRVQLPLGCPLPPPLVRHRRVVRTPTPGWGTTFRAPLSQLHWPCHSQDSISATTEHFQPHWHPDGRGLLPRHLHQPPSGYHQESLPCCLCAGGVSPQHRWHHQDVPKSLGECGGGCTEPGKGLGGLVALGTAVSPGGFWGVSMPTPGPGGFRGRLVAPGPALSPGRFGQGWWP